MGQWTKYFLDGSKYEASDIAVLRHDASWTKSRNEGIVKVELSHDKFFCSIQGLGNYWQSDDFISVASQEVILSKIVTRRIQRQVELTDSFLSLNESYEGIQAKFFRVPPDFSKNWKNYIPINKRMAGKWLTIEINIENGFVRHYFSEDKI